MKLDSQAVQVTAIIGIVLIVLALIAATVYAPNSGVQGLLTLVGGVITVLLGLAKLQSIGAQQAVNTQSIARVESKVDTVHDKVDGLNEAALFNQDKLSQREGFDKGVAASAQVAAAAMGAAIPSTLPATDTPILTQEIPPTDPRYLPPSGKPSV